MEFIEVLQQEKVILAFAVLGLISKSKIMSVLKKISKNVDFKEIFIYLINKIILIVSIGLFIFIFYTNKVNIFEKFILSFILFIIVGKLKKRNVFYREIYNELSIKEYEKLIIITFLITYGIFCFFEPIKYVNNYTKPIFIFSFLALVSIEIYNLIEIFWKKNNLKDKIDLIEKKTIEYRLEEASKLEELIQDEDITSILIDDKIGNGKTYLIEYFLKKNDNKYEIIYIKLPLVENLEELKITIFKEIRIILKKNQIKSNFIKEFFLSNLKLKVDRFEFGVNKNNEKRTNWDSIKELKSGLEELDKLEKSILIIIDDIERVSNKEFLKDSLLYLGEFSEHFRESKTTTVFLAQYGIIKNTLKDIEGYRIEFLDKYFKYKLRLKTPQVNELRKEDLEKILVDSYNSYYKKNKDKDEVKKMISIEQYIRFVSNTLEILFYQIGSVGGFSKNIKGDIRNLIRYSKKINPILKEGLYNFPGIVYCTYILFELFIPDLIVTEETIKTFLLKLIKNNKDLNGIDYDENLSQILHENYLNDCLCDYYEITSFDKLVNNLINIEEYTLDQKVIDELSAKDLKKLIENIDYKKLKRVFKYSLINVRNSEELFNILIYKILEHRNKMFYMEEEYRLNFYSLLKNLLIEGCVFNNYKYNVDVNEKKEIENVLREKYLTLEREIIKNIELEKFELIQKRTENEEKSIEIFKKNLESKVQSTLTKSIKKVKGELIKEKFEFLINKISDYKKVLNNNRIELEKDLDKDTNLMVKIQNETNKIIEKNEIEIEDIMNKKEEKKKEIIKNRKILELNMDLKIKDLKEFEDREKTTQREVAYGDYLNMISILKKNHNTIKEQEEHQKLKADYMNRIVAIDEKIENDIKRKLEIYKIQLEKEYSIEEKEEKLEMLEAELNLKIDFINMVKEEEKKEIEPIKRRIESIKQKIISIGMEEREIETNFQKDADLRYKMKEEQEIARLQEEQENDKEKSVSEYTKGLKVAKEYQIEKELKEKQINEIEKIKKELEVEIEKIEKKLKAKDLETKLEELKKIFLANREIIKKNDSRLEKEINNFLTQKNNVENTVNLV